MLGSRVMCVNNSMHWWTTNTAAWSLPQSLELCEHVDSRRMGATRPIMAAANLYDSELGFWTDT